MKTLQTATPTVYRLLPEALPLEEKKIPLYVFSIFGVVALSLAIVTFPAFFWGYGPYFANHNRVDGLNLDFNNLFPAQKNETASPQMLENL